MTDRSRKLTVIGMLAVAFVGVVGWRAWAMYKDPDVALLLPEGGAEWIRLPKAEGPTTYGPENWVAAYKTTFTVEEPGVDNARLTIRAYQFVEVFIDKVHLGGAGDYYKTKNPHWKTPITLSFDHVEPGEHEIVLSVVNRTGPPVVLAYSDALGIHTGDHWIGRDHDDESWRPVVTADAPQTNTHGKELQRADKAFLEKLPVFVPIFLIVFLWSVIVMKSPGRYPWLERITPSASGIRWLLLVAWGVLAANNIVKVPWGVGFDIGGHLEYMQYIIRNRSIPLAAEGWQMFQAPFYYLFSTPLYLLFSTTLSEAKAAEALRFVPMLCGALLVQIGYHTMRLVYPDRGDLQALGTVICGLIPINLYISQNLANEPMVAVFSALTILTALWILQKPTKRWRLPIFALLGLFLGLAVLTKVTAVLLIPCVSLLVLYVAWLRNHDVYKTTVDATKALVVTGGVVFAVAGWYFIRNWALQGAPYIGGWEEIRGYIWWQEPGYRTIGQFFEFGHALFYPVYSSVHGFWDGVYSTLWMDGYLGSQTQPDYYPPWNYGFMLSSAWLSLVPSAAIILGIVYSLWRYNDAARHGQLFALVCVAVYFAAIISLALRIPSFSTIKATYTLGIVSCYGILAAAGFRLVARNVYLRAGVYGAMACWAVAAYAAYFIL